MPADDAATLPLAALSPTPIILRRCLLLPPLARTRHDGYCERVDKRYAVAIPIFSMPLLMLIRR